MTRRSGRSHRPIHYVLLVVVGIPAALTIVGVVFRSRALLAVVGVSIYFVLFVLFIAVGKLLRPIRSLIAEFGGENRGSTAIVDLLLRFEIMSRGLFLTLGLWTVHFYRYLIDRFADSVLVPDDLSSILQKNVGLSIAAMGAAAVDTMRGRDLWNDQGIPTRLLTFSGAFGFLRNLMLLAAAMDWEHRYWAVRAVLSDPLWFARGAAADRIVSYLFPFFLSFPQEWFWPVLEIFGIIVSVQAIRYEKQDGRNFAWALLSLSCWGLTVPLYAVTREVSR